jgi:hypothetical protein
MTQQQPYTVVRTDDDFEVRAYPDHVLAQVDVVGALGAGAGAGFGPLFQYISGANDASQSIAMTAPVLQQSEGAAWQTISFVLPADMNSVSAPAPHDPRVRTTAVTARFVAARRFSGTARSTRFADQGAQLVAAATAAGLKTVGEVYYARFDPPWKPGFMRHNEALIEVASTIDLAAT